MSNLGLTFSEQLGDESKFEEIREVLCRGQSRTGRAQSVGFFCDTRGLASAFIFPETRVRFEKPARSLVVIAYRQELAGIQTVLRDQFYSCYTHRKSRLD